MKRTMLILLIGLLVGIPAVDAGAGWFQRRDKQRQRPAPHRFSDVPRRSLLNGELTQDHRGAWRLGDSELLLGADCLVRVEGSPENTLVSGSQAMVLGTRIGDTILVRQIRVRRPSKEIYPQPNRSRYGIVWSESNPHLGVGTIQGIE